MRHAAPLLGAVALLALPAAPAADLVPPSAGGPRAVAPCREAGPTVRSLVFFQGDNGVLETFDAPFSPGHYMLVDARGPFGEADVIADLGVRYFGDGKSHRARITGGPVRPSEGRALAVGPVASPLPRARSIPLPTDGNAFSRGDWVTFDAVDLDGDGTVDLAVLARRDLGSDPPRRQVEVRHRAAGAWCAVERRPDSRP